MKIAVLHSGDANPESTRPDEYETVQTCEDIEASLAKLGHDPVRVRFYDDLGRSEEALKAQAPDLVFNMVETANGTDRLSYIGPALLEMLGIPYTGCPAAAIAMASSKTKMKKFMQAAGVPTPAYFNGVGSGTGGPWIVKSSTEHASMGIDVSNIVQTADEAAGIVKRLCADGSHWFAERFIDGGGEYNVYMLSDESGHGLQVLGTSELTFTNQPEGKPKIYDYAAKWHFESQDYDAIGRNYDVPAGLRGLMEGYAARVWDGLGLRGAARLDFRVDADGVPYVIDINLNPCMSTGCIFAEAAERVGVTYDDIIRRLVKSAADH
ncbi:MAG: hypothetical protein KGQ41_08165 [Alphaproteobacteria bacterium]|nr:hypothetical protein [Alphaproteobacteria bacterium]